MADLVDKDASLSAKLVGQTSAGVETNPVNSDAKGQLFVKDAINSSVITGAISVTTSAAEAKVGASRLTDRKLLSLLPTNGTIYWGYSNAVTTSTGMPIFKNQQKNFAFTDNVPIYVIAATTIDVRAAEGA